MSLESWTEEYYPTAASDCSIENALVHSLKKWQGLLPAILEGYGVEKDGSDIYDDNAALSITSETCALCKHFFLPDGHSYNACSSCPLSISRNGTQCDEPAPGEDISPYYAFCDNGDPLPMIQLIETAVRESKPTQLRFDVQRASDGRVLGMFSSKEIMVNLQNR